MHLYFTNLPDNKILMIMCVPCKFINQLSHVEVRVVAAKLQITIGCCHKRRKFTLNYKLAWKRNKLLCQTFLNIEDIKNPWWDIKERRRAGFGPVKFCTYHEFNNAQKCRNTTNFEFPFPFTFFTILLIKKESGSNSKLLKEACCFNLLIPIIHLNL